MFLKSLEIQGFKSFADKIKLDFQKGLTAVVGPNGSGKSNISDAVRWVLGEQSTKTLRGAKMEDVIFSGTKKRSPMGFCEVKLTFDNTDRMINNDNNLITISRKLKRSGESTYKIDDKNVRLKDIHELLMDTGLGRGGYSIIGQGKITEIVESKSSDRREIFEEAAGISKFKYKKFEAEKRLVLAQENLNRLKDILTELEDRIGPLKIQAQKAKQYQSLSFEEKKLEISLFLESLSQIKIKIRDMETKILICDNDYDTIKTELDKIEQLTDNASFRTNQLFAQKDSLENLIRKKEELISEKQQKIAVLDNDISHIDETIKRLKEESNEQRSAATQLSLSIESKEQQLKQKLEKLLNLKEKKLNLQNELTNINAERNLQNEKLISINTQINDLSMKLSAININSTASKGQMDDLRDRYTTLNNDCLKKKQQLNDLQDKLQESQKFSKNMNNKVINSNNILDGYNKKKEAKQESIDSAQKNISQCELKIKEKQNKIKLLTEMEKNMEGYNYSVKTILNYSNSNEIKGVIGTLSDIISVDNKYTLAIETALGSALQNIIVDTEKNAKACIELLKQKKAGRATFLPLTSIKGKTLAEKNLEENNGFINTANNLVKTDAKFQQIILSLLGRIAVCDNLDNAAELSKKFGYRFKIVTLDGQVINPGGSFTGGSNYKSVGLLSRKNEINTLANEVEKIIGDFENMKNEYNQKKSELDKLSSTIIIIKSEIRTAQEDLVKNDFDIKIIQQNLQDTNNLIRTYNNENELLLSKIQKCEEQLADFETQKINISKEILIKNKEKSSLDTNIDGTENKSEKIIEEISNLSNGILTLEKDSENIENSITDLKSRMENKNTKLKEKEDEIIHVDSKKNKIFETIKSFTNEKNSVKNEIADLESSIVKIGKEMQDVEQEKNELRIKTNKTTLQREDIAKELTKLQNQKAVMETEHDDIVGKLWDRYELAVSDASQFAIKIDDFHKCKRNLQEIKNKIKALGDHINIGAIEEYEQVSKRYELLKSQTKDAEDSKNQLIDLISELTGKMRKIFTEQFDKINKNFSQIFVELFNGGSAVLALTGTDDVLESGIEILADLPGKIVNNLMSYSGGEQAFIAIALYFAIMKVNPSPFCILDEIEANLDDVNVYKYAAYLRKMNKDTQFIMITHRRGTMEEADILYGVTMKNEGVSELLELNVSEVESRLGIQ